MGPHRIVRGPPVLFSCDLIASIATPLSISISGGTACSPLYSALDIVLQLLLSDVLLRDLPDWLLQVLLMSKSLIHHFLLAGLLLQGLLLLRFLWPLNFLLQSRV